MIIINQPNYIIVEYIKRYIDYNNKLNELMKKIIDSYFNIYDFDLNLSNEDILNRLNILIKYISNITELIEIFNNNYRYFSDENYFVHDNNINNIIIKKINLFEIIKKKSHNKFTCLSGFNYIESSSESDNFLEFFSINDIIIFANEPNIEYKIIDINKYYIIFDKYKYKSSINEYIYIHTNIYSILKEPKVFNNSEDWVSYYNLNKLSFIKEVSDQVSNNKYLLENLLEIYRQQL
jgi:hypothetical protein